MTIRVFVLSSILCPAILSAQSPVNPEPPPPARQEIATGRDEVTAEIERVAAEIKGGAVVPETIVETEDVITQTKRNSAEIEEGVKASEGPVEAKIGIPQRDDDVIGQKTVVKIVPVEPEYMANCRKPCTDSLYRDAKIALKSNLLFDLVGAPNLGVEIPVGKERRFSITADIGYAYWQINNTYALQTLQGGIGAKYWFNPEKGVLTGWNAGVYGIYGGPYDVQWKDGYQGNSFWSAGLSGGYAWRISRSWRLEFAVAAGVFHTPEVRHYHRPENGHLIWEETRYNVTRFFPTKLQLNLVWLIGEPEKVKDR